MFLGSICLAIICLPIMYELYDSVDSIFRPISNWLDGAIIELDEDSLSDYLDNSEYDWGHNVKNYIEEDV